MLLPTGAHTLSVVYAGDDMFAPSSTETDVQVDAAPTTVQIQVDATTVRVDQPIEVDAIVRVPGEHDHDPAGFVELLIDGEVWNVAGIGEGSI